jgi:hypothetical protein
MLKEIRISHRGLRYLGNTYVGLCPIKVFTENALAGLIRFKYGSRNKISYLSVTVSSKAPPCYSL